MLVDDNKIRIIKSMYQKGMRVKLREMKDSYTNLKEGDEGTIEFVDDLGTIFVKWDNGSGLGLIIGEDSFEIMKFIKETLENGSRNEEMS